MCDVPSIAVFCRESIECFPGTASKFFLKLLVIITIIFTLQWPYLHNGGQVKLIQIVLEGVQALNRRVFFQRCVSKLFVGSVSVAAFSIPLSPGEDRGVHRALVGKPEERVHWGDQDVDGRIILRWIFKKLEEVVGTGWSWLRIGTDGGHLWVR